MDRIEIDINCDVGEGIGNESSLFPYISSCNIACGGHAGNFNSIEEVVLLARKYQVKIGAHPSYPDKENFGRVSMSVSSNKLKEAIKQQVDNLLAVLSKHNSILHHIKPHGALYNDIAKDKVKAAVFLDAIKKYKKNVYLYVPFNSVIEAMAIRSGFMIKREAFGDRNYNTDLSLVSRKQANALIENPTMVKEHLMRMIMDNKIKTSEGEFVEIIADTYCIHGDTPNALKILMYLSVELTKLNIFIKK